MHLRSRGEMDIIAAFEAVVPGSNPGGSTGVFDSSTEGSNCFDPDRIRKDFRCRVFETESHPRR